MTESSLDLQESGWEELRREARKIEGDLDVKLSSYAKLGARFNQGGYGVDGGSPGGSWKSMEIEIQSSLEKLLDINDSMSRCAASAAPTISVTQKLARHRDILHEYTQIDEVIGQAQATRAVLGSQRSLFSDVQGKVKNLGDKFPVIRGLLGSIRRRRSRDTLILSAVIAACTLFIIIYWLSK
ncbi:hypothetical protein DY000_02036018 [Brassica cretica]|uniref:Golgi SNAP receptor complex member 1 n=1 Tax=Brassica cretica TaxID=69181 RepID=A0ABQ7DZ71_BRACR|nr:hypothetical protein DY000_02036018 [Brassica cretica]